MNYLKRVAETLRAINFEKFSSALVHAMRSILVIGTSATIYWLIDHLIVDVFLKN